MDHSGRSLENKNAEENRDSRESAHEVSQSNKDSFTNYTREYLYYILAKNLADGYLSLETEGLN